MEQRLVYDAKALYTASLPANSVHLLQADNDKTLSISF